MFSYFWKYKFAKIYKRIFVFKFKEWLTNEAYNDKILNYK